MDPQNAVNTSARSMKSGPAQSEKVAELAICAVFTALICIFTMFIQIRIFPTEGGMVHIGNVPLFFAAAYFGGKTGAVSGGLGMCLSDLLTGWTLYAPATLIVVGIMGLVFGMIVDRKPTVSRLLVAVAAVLAIKLAGYYLFEAAFVYQNMAAPVVNVPGNTIQILTGAIVAVPVILAVKPVMKHLAGRQQKEGIKEEEHV